MKEQDLLRQEREKQIKKMLDLAESAGRILYCNDKKSKGKKELLTLIRREFLETVKKLRAP